MFQKYSTLPARSVRQGKKGGPVHVKGCKTRVLYTTPLQAAPTEERISDSDLRLHHIPEDFELLNKNKNQNNEATVAVQSRLFSIFICFL
jgi:hypothetical protein